MIKKFETVTELTIDSEQFEVAAMSEKVQDLVILFNKIGVDEFNAKLDVVKCQRALLTVHNDIIVTIREEREAVKSAEEAENKEKADVALGGDNEVETTETAESAEDEKE